jgi:hypothetical protein
MILAWNAYTSKKLISASIRKNRNSGGSIVGTWKSQVLGAGSNPGRKKGQNDSFERMLTKQFNTKHKNNVPDA